VAQIQAFAPKRTQLAVLFNSGLWDIQNYCSNKQEMRQWQAENAPLFRVNDTHGCAHEYERHLSVLAWEIVKLRPALVVYR
jgi:hypothetical protein